MNLDVAAARALLEHPWIKALVILTGSIAAALLVGCIMKWCGRALAKRNRHAAGATVMAIVSRPVSVTVAAVGAAWALSVPHLPSALMFVILALLKSAAIIVWAAAAGRIVDAAVARLGAVRRFTILQPRTMPIFNIVSMLMIWGGASYLVLLAWNINITGWLASAGIVGIAVGFAAKDTLANLFAGIFILADAPYKLGDYIILGSGERGKVTDIGVRSTRILTRDDIEITIPNAVIANTMITNESGGPHAKERIRCTVSVAYGSDVDQVRDVLMAAALENTMICNHPEPRVRLRSFGDSGLVFQVLGWIDEPELQGLALDSLNTSVYKKLHAAQIEIPYPKRDVYIKQAPGNT